MVYPNYLTNMEDRLKSRFNAGMIVDIPAPDHESRVAILKTRNSTRKFLFEWWNNRFFSFFNGLHKYKESLKVLWIQ